MEVIAVVIVVALEVLSSFFFTYINSNISFYRWIFFSKNSSTILLLAFILGAIVIQVVTTVLEISIDILTELFFILTEEPS